MKNFSKKVFFIACVISGLSSIFTLQSLVEANPQRIEASGSYMIGDGPDESIAVAKERARVDAMRMATEKAGIYVESYSESQGHILTKDDVRVISSQILSIENEDIEPTVTNDNHIVMKCKIVATVDPDNINLKKMMENRKAVAQVAELEKKIDKLQSENNQLKEMYKKSNSLAEKENLSNQIKENEKSFNNSALSTPLYTGNSWKSGIDPESVFYDKNKGIITFTTTSINEKSGVKSKSGFKIYIKENKIFRTGSVGYLPGHTDSFSYKGGHSFGLEPIPPDSYADKYQKRVYAYLGITSSSINKPAKWEYIGTYRGNGDTFFIDVNNIKCDKDKGTVNAYGKEHSVQYGDSYNTYTFDIKNMELWYFMVESGRFYLEKHLSQVDICYLNFAREYYNNH